MAEVRVLFVCLGNICRSPLAEGVFARLVAAQGLGDRVAVDSAGTHGYHIGSPPDPRAISAAARRGFDLSALRGRQARKDDFHNFDYIIAMDHANRRNLLSLAPAGYEDRVRMMMEFAEGFGEEVGDPYYGGDSGFEVALDMLEAAASGLLAEVRQRLDDRRD